MMPIAVRCVASFCAVDEVMPAAPFPLKVAPPLTLMIALASDAVGERVSVPAVTLVSPKLFVPPIVSVPLPLLVNPPLPVMPAVALREDDAAALTVSPAASEIGAL